MTFHMDWSEHRAKFVYAGEQGVVTLTARHDKNGWHPLSAYTHVEGGEAENETGVCPFVIGRCHTTEIEPSRTAVPVHQWARHDNDPALVEEVMRQWYEEFVA